MPYGAGLFLPSETAYKDPNRFADVLAAEGNKQAAYLADMDQFFAQLEEMKREFDVTAEMKERFFAEERVFAAKRACFTGSSLSNPSRRSVYLLWRTSASTGPCNTPPGSATLH